MYKRIISFTMVWLTIAGGVLLGQDYSWEDISRGAHDLQALLVSLQDNRIIFVGASGSVLKSDDAGKSWRRVISVRSGLKNINVLVFDPGNSNNIYAATDNGLYGSKDLGERWERVFRGKSDKENQCTAVLATPYAIFVGTRAGLFISRDHGRSWQKENGQIDNTTVFNIDSNFRLGEIIYLAAARGIFKSLNGGKSWERIFLSYNKRNDQEEVFDAEKTNDEDNPSDVRFVKADSNNLNSVYFSTTKGVYRSLDQGKTWNKLNEYGLLSRDVKILCLLGESRIIGLTQSGAFIYQDDRWAEISFNLAAGKLSYLALDAKGGIYITGERGIFRSSQLSSYELPGQVLVQEYLKHEPKIADVQKAAIKYAEVDSEKILHWRKMAAKKALLPQISIGLDRNSTDLWHWEGGSTTRAEDDNLRRGKDNIDWDVSLSWDLSDLIWNDAQTSIDVRSKLMVELRDDILDEVNKLYFERLRVKSELDNLAIEDRNKRFDKQLKLEELTASLDSLTAGYYSEQLRLIMTKK